MAGSSGTASVRDVQGGNRNVVGQIAQLSWDKVKSAAKMAGSERAYARKKLKVGEEGGLSKEEFRERFGRGSFFKKALGSEFGGDKIARNRGRIASFLDEDVPAGRDPTKSKRSRYRSQFDYGGVEPQDPMVGGKTKTDSKKEAGERKQTRTSRMAINEAMASALAGIEIHLTKLSEKFTTTVSVPEGLIEVINKQSKVITEGFDGLSKALYSLLGSIQKQTATMVRLDQEQKILDQKNLDRQQALDEENALEDPNGGAGNSAVKSFGKNGKGGGGGGGILGKMFGATALAKRIGRRGAARAGIRAAAAFGGKNAAKTMAKTLGKSAAKTGLKTGLKKIPLLGLGVSALFAAQRAMKGDILGAGLELASGAASTVPGLGTAASLGVDGILAARDAGAIPFVGGGFIPGGKPVFGMIGEKLGVNEMVLPWTAKTFAMMNKARLDALKRYRSKYADVHSKAMEEYYENRGGWEKFGDTLVNLLKGVMPNLPTGNNNNNNNNGTIDYDNLQSGDISDMGGKAAVIYGELRDQGVTDEGAKRFVAEVGREGGFQNTNLFGSHQDPADASITNTGMISWNSARRTRLIAAARDAGVWDESKGQFQETAEALRFQTRFALNEMTGSGASQNYKDTYALMTDPNAKGSDIAQALRQKFIVYQANARFSDGYDAEYGSGATKRWYEKVTPGLERTYRTPEENPTPPITTSAEANQLGQAITNSYGLEVGQERWFEVPGYGRIKAHKTRTGFDFYGPGFNNKLSMHPSRPQAKAIYEHFIRTEGGRVKIEPTPSSSEQSNKAASESEQASIRRTTNGANVQVAYIDTNAGSNAAVPQSSASSRAGLGFSNLAPAFAILPT